MPIKSGVFELLYAPPPWLRRWRAGWRLVAPNGVTTEGVNYLLEAAFRGGTQQPAWYGGLIDAAGFTALDPADTHLSHPGWAEFTAVGTRPAWTPGAAAGGLLVGTAPVVFTTASAGSVRGAFLASRAAVGLGSGAVIWATADAAAERDVDAGGTVTLTYLTRLRAR